MCLRNWIYLATCWAAMLCWIGWGGYYVANPQYWKGVHVRTLSDTMQHYPNWVPVVDKPKCLCIPSGTNTGISPTKRSENDE